MCARRIHPFDSPKSNFLITIRPMYNDNLMKVYYLRFRIVILIIGIGHKTSSLFDSEKAILKYEFYSVATSRTCHASELFPPIMQIVHDFIHITHDQILSKLYNLSMRTLNGIKP